MEKQQGAILIITLCILLSVALMGMTTLKTGVFQQKMVTNMQLDALTFHAAESSINAVIDELHEHPENDPMSTLMVTKQLVTCLSDAGLSIGTCGNQPLSSNKQKKGTHIPALVARAHTQYIGIALVPGYAVDQMAYHRFETKGIGHFDGILPYGHVNVQSWQKMGPISSAFEK